MSQSLENDLIMSSVLYDHTSETPKTYILVVHYLFIAAYCFSGIIFTVKCEGMSD